MKFEDVRKYVKGVLTGSFSNKSTLDKLSTSGSGTLLFNGNEIKGGVVDGVSVKIPATSPAHTTSGRTSFTFHAKFLSATNSSNLSIVIFCPVVHWEHTRCITDTKLLLAC